MLRPTTVSNELGISIDAAKKMTSPSRGYGELVREGFIKDDIFYPEGVPDNKDNKVDNDIKGFRF